MSQHRREHTQTIPDKSKNGLSLRARLVLFVLFVSLIPLIAITTHDTFQTQQALINGAEISLKSGAAQTANSVENFIQKTLDSVGAEAQLADVINYLAITQSARTGITVRERTLDLLDDLSKKDSTNIISYALVDPRGNVLLDSATNIQYNESKEAYFSQIQISDKPIVTAVTYSKDGTTSITFAAKVLNDNGGDLGVLRVKFRASVLQDVIVQSVGPSADTSAVLLDQLHIRMADSQNPELIQKSVVPLDAADYLIAVDTHRFLDIPSEEQATSYPDFESALDNAVEQPFFTADINPSIEGDDTIAVAFMQTQPWIISYSRPTSNFLADVQKQTRVNIILIIFTSILITIVATVIVKRLTDPIVSLTKTANAISQGNLSARAEISSTTEIGTLASAFNSMTDRLQSTLVGLEQRITERTVDQQRITLEMEIVAEVAREITIIHDLSTLLNVSANLIRERFKYYHVGIFLVDERGEFAVLRAASSVAANQMLEQNYKLKVGQEGLVGTVTRMGQAHIALDIGADATRFQNPYLPQTRSEIALPLRSRSITIGALDIQTDIQSAFSEHNIKALQLLADQLSAAIENAQLVKQVNETLSELKNTYRLQTQSEWQSVIRQYEQPAYEYDGIQARAIPQNLPANLLQQLENGEPIILSGSDEQNTNSTKTTLMVPLMVLNQVIGVIGLEQEGVDHVWTNEDISIAQAAANRAGITLENARLLKESQRRAAKERAIGDISAKISANTQIEMILKTVVQELGNQIGNAQVSVEIEGDDQ